MSTKSTIAYGQDFHFYTEVFDDDHAYLELKNGQFEASDRHVMVAIPVTIWETIRQHSMVDFSYADQTDEELRRHVEQEVQTRIEEFAHADERKQPIINLRGSLVYGPADAPKEAQIANGLDYFRKLRDRQRKIRRDIAHLRNMAVDEGIHADGGTQGLVTINPEILGGTPVFAGTSVPVSVLFENLADGMSLDAVLDAYPALPRDLAVKALRLSGQILVQPITQGEEAIGLLADGLRQAANRASKSIDEALKFIDQSNQRIQDKERNK